MWPPHLTQVPPLQNRFEPLHMRLGQHACPTPPQGGGPQVPFVHTPPGHGPVMFIRPQTPIEQVARVQAVVPSHAEHGMPRVPHTGTVMPGWQTIPSQQPRQQTPARQVPSGQVAAEHGGGPMSGPGASGAASGGRGASPGASGPRASDRKSVV